MTPYNTYREALLKFMWDTQFSRPVLINILQWYHIIGRQVDLAEASNLGSLDEDQQEEHRNIIGSIDEDVDIIDRTDGETEGDQDQGDLLDTDLDQLDLGDCNFDWRTNKNLELVSVLNDHTLIYYTAYRNKGNIDNDSVLNNNNIH